MSPAFLQLAGAIPFSDMELHMTSGRWVRDKVRMQEMAQAIECIAVLYASHLYGSVVFCADIRPLGPALGPCQTGRSSKFLLAGSHNMGPH